MPNANSARNGQGARLLQVENMAVPFCVPLSVPNRATGI